MKRLIAVALSVMMAFTYGFTWTEQAHAIPKADGQIHEPIQTASKDYKEHEALVMFKSGKTKKAARAALKAAEADDYEIADSWEFSEPVSAYNEEGTVQASGLSYTNVALVRSKTLTTKQLVEIFNKRDDVLYAEPNYRIQALDVSDDAYSSLQWSMGESGGNVEYEWNEKGVAGSDAIVAVVDTGVNYEHEDLAGNMWENDNYPKLKGDHGFDFSKADDDPMDENGHGTHCAGIIGAVGNNGIGISGVNQKIKIMALRILDEEGSGYNSEEIAAYNYISKALDLGEPIKAINNSWGGGEYSEIFAELVDVVGEKGAVSVFAAGNDGMNVDEYPDYPASIESDYKIVVAATREDGQLASFSNYGTNTVDVAAPGADILSSVSYDCYNPSIYTDEEQEAISSEFNNYEQATIQEEDNEWGIVDASEIKLPEGASYEASITDEGVNGSKALHMSFKNMRSDTVAFIPIKYTLDSNEPENAPVFSYMNRADTPAKPGQYDGSFFVAFELPASVEYNQNNFEKFLLYGYYISGQQDSWDHVCCNSLEDSSDEIETERNFVMALYAASNGDYDIILDDLGISKETVDSEQFKQYDFMSGTSMATPFISGAVALKAAELGDVDPVTLIDETTSLAKESPELQVSAGGAFDFGKKPVEMGPKIRTIKIGEEKGTILITGGGLNPGSGLTVEISYAGRDAYQTAEIISQNEKGTEVIIKDNGWINNVVDVRVTGYKSKVAKKDNVYLVSGKEELEEFAESFGEIPSGRLVASHNRVYALSSASDALLVFNPSDPEEGFVEAATVDPDEIFDYEKNDNAMYDMLFSRDMACINGKIYTVVEFGEAVEEYNMDDDDWFIFSKAGKANVKSSSKDEDEDSEYAANGVLYSSELHLISISPSSGEVTDLGQLPEDLEKTMDFSIAAYNSKLYFIGGYSMAKESKGLTTAVKIYDPSSEKWSKGPALPNGRAFGYALQTGDKLVYTMGYSDEQKGVDVDEQKCPANLIFNGKSWTISNASLMPLNVSDEVKRGADHYVIYGGNIGLCKGGIVYIATPSEDYGDTFIYNVKNDAFTDTGYNYYKSLDEATVSATALGTKSYVFGNDEKIMSLSVKTGLMKVTCNKVKSKHGKVTGVNRYYLPGDKAKVVVKAKKKYRIKSMKVDGKKVKLKKKARKKTYVTTPLTKDVKFKIKFKKR